MYCGESVIIIKINGDGLCLALKSSFIITQDDVHFIIYKKSYSDDDIFFFSFYSDDDDIFFFLFKFT